MRPQPSTATWSRECSASLPERTTAFVASGRGRWWQPDSQVVAGFPEALPECERVDHCRDRARDEERLRAKYGRFGGIAVAFSEEKQSTSAWDRGAVGEERLGARLDKLAADGPIEVLHDRLIPGTRANIDHIVVAPGGVWVVDSKRYYRQTPALRVEGGLFRPRVE